MNYHDPPAHRFLFGFAVPFTVMLMAACYLAIFGLPLIWVLGLAFAAGAVAWLKAVGPPVLFKVPGWSQVAARLDPGRRRGLRSSDAFVAFALLGGIALWLNADLAIPWYAALGLAILAVVAVGAVVFGGTRTIRARLEKQFGIEEVVLRWPKAAAPRPRPDRSRTVPA